MENNQTVELVRRQCRQGHIRQPFRTIPQSLDTLRALNAEQNATGHEDIRQFGHNEQSIAVVLLTATANLGRAENLFDEEGILDIGPHMRLGSFFLQLAVA